MGGINLQEKADEFYNDEQRILYFYTPLCGTCAVAEKYIKIVEEMDSVSEVRKLDINYWPKLAEAWKIESVPCLIRIEKNNSTKKMYAMENVLKIYEFIRGDNNDRT
nr:thioredoxin family protein [Alkalicoccus halolimnae]